MSNTQLRMAGDIGRLTAMLESLRDDYKEGRVRDNKVVERLEVVESGLKDVGAGVAGLERRLDDLQAAPQRALDQQEQSLRIQINQERVKILRYVAGAAALVGGGAGLAVLVERWLGL